MGRGIPLPLGSDRTSLVPSTPEPCSGVTGPICREQIEFFAPAPLANEHTYMRSIYVCWVDNFTEP